MAKPLFDVTVKGVALENKGLTEWDSISGVGLLTYGFVWPCSEIWYLGCLGCEGVTTTIWAACDFGATTTVWTPCDFGATTTTWTPFSPYVVEEC